jgi:glycosyltransferase involved in cell wall biosynthesis
MEQFEKGLVSIIIPVFNRESLLPETLDSIVSQTYEKWECIIVDDGSKDSSLNVALGYEKKDNRFKVYNRPWYKKKGANSCRNYGFKLSKGEFIQWFDSDDCMDKNFLSFLIKLLKIGGADLGVAQSKYVELTPREEKNKNRFKQLINSSNPAFAFLFEDAWFQTSQVLVSRRIIELEGNLFDKNLKRNQEAEYFIRLILTGGRIACFDEYSLVDIKIHESSISGLYNQKKLSEKYKYDYKAYIKMYNSFKKACALHKNVSDEFRIFFLSCLKKMEPLSFEYFSFYFYSFRTRYFDNKKVAFKIFIARNFNSLFNK